MISRPRLQTALIALALVLAGCGSLGADPAGKTDAASGSPAFVRLLSQADTAVAGGALADAGRLLDKARAIEPDNPDLWVAIARLRYRGGEHLTALEAADRALELGPDHAPALYLRALMVRDAHGLADALPWFEAALRADRGHADAWAEYAATLGDLGRYGDMLDAVRELAEVAPGDPRVFYLQAVLAQRGGEPVLARNLLERSGMAARGVPSAIMLEALIHMDQGNHTSAAERLEALAARQPANARVRALLARALLLGGREADLVARFAPEIATPEASPYLLTLVARAHERLGDRASAAPLLERAARGSAAAPVVLADGAGLPALTAGLRQAGLAGDWMAAQTQTRTLRAQFPASADIALLAGDTRLGSGDAASALEAYSLAARVRRPWPLTRKAVLAYTRAGDSIAANTLLARYVAGDQQNISALAALAQSLAQRGEWQRTGLLLDHAIALGGANDPAVLSLRSKAARALGQGEDAARFDAALADLRPAALVQR
ncbi:MAG: tetratricopeptide repeat protein [Erythrobacter sp.]|nr:tetratricopeptide repeat protein [Erythrobacter sp.]